ncbi:MAG: class I tRNA ligase family protein [Candidatus Kaiserbacteria bacterium]|nr:class I tRNA ligase family protein [Candidatus Kaiserbacteria bacterium]
MGVKQPPADDARRSSVAEQEKKVLTFWQENDIFEKSERRERGFWNKVRNTFRRKKPFIFYDGPPFATGLPHYGSILQSVVKDALLRYKTMRGYTVRRRWGWDCHGLPVEVEVEQAVGLKTKRDVEEHGIREFNEKARETVFRHAKEWEQFIQRIGRWVDMSRGYRTMDVAYTESVWAAFRGLHRKGLASAGRKILHLCPRCSTTISNAEVAENYTTLTDTEVYVLFPSTEDEGLSFVAWTTTPWTLFGNVALGVHKDLDYVVAEKEGKRYVLHERALGILGDATIVAKKKGSEFIGHRYRPPLPSLHVSDDEQQRVHRIYHAPYVEDSTGTAVVHLAPAYGEEDMELAKRERLPIRHHVTIDGVFTDDLKEFAGLRPKESGNPKDVDEKICNELDRRGVLLHRGTVEHSYPICWRCDTPLLNYATDSWFVHAERLRDQMVAENRTVRWVPGHLRDGRFGNWLASAKEWSVSRTRFWGAPLPVWTVKKTGETFVVGSIEEMLDRMRPKNSYLFVRHGESKHNRRKLFHCQPGDSDGLTERGKRQATAAGKKIRDRSPTVIFCSPLPRAKQTAERIAKETGAKVIEDPLLTELQVPSLNNRPIRELLWEIKRGALYKHIDTPVADGESYRDIYRRIQTFLETVDAQYEGETIVVVTHRMVINLAKAMEPLVSEMTSRIASVSILPTPYCSITSVPYKGVHWDEHGDIDLHRPYIDDIVLFDDNGNPAYHNKEVFDCWFESGAMPYGSHHYPFARGSSFDPERGNGFPADFICEGLDQTRGWFYSLMAIAVGLFDRAPYRNVVTTGLIRASDGRKMSKRLKNYTDPLQLIDQYGADSLRHYLLASPVVRGQDIDFQEEQVHDVYKKIYTRLGNCFSFYESYAHLPHRRGRNTALLDTYIRSRLAMVQKSMTDGFEGYRMDLAAGPIAAFVDDLSTWYIRRSRDRIRSDSADGARARETLRFVLTETAKCIAPIAPFFAEHLFSRLKKYHSPVIPFPESVHLCSWSRSMPVRQDVVEAVDSIRHIVSLAHEVRSRAGIPVRQPLRSVTIKEAVSDEGKHIIAEEVNVKEVIVTPAADEVVVLDTVLDDSLRTEGFVRSYIRNIQGVRKKMQCSLTEVLARMYVYLPTEEKQRQLKQFEDHIKKELRVEEVIYDKSPRDGAHECTVDGTPVHVVLVKQPGRLSV